MHARWRHPRRCAVFAGAEIPPVRQGAPVLRRGRSSALWLFLSPQLVGALSTSALRAERAFGVSGGRRRGSASAPAPAPDPLPHTRRSPHRSTADCDKGDRQKVRVSKKLGKLRSCFFSPGCAYLAVRLSLLCPCVSCPLSPGLFTQRRADLIVHGLLGFAAQMGPFCNPSVFGAALGPQRLPGPPLPAPAPRTRPITISVISCRLLCVV